MVALAAWMSPGVLESWSPGVLASQSPKNRSQLRQRRLALSGCGWGWKIHPRGVDSALWWVVFFLSGCIFFFLLRSLPLFGSH